MTGDKIRVLIADDHAVVRDGIRRILDDEAEVEVVGEARDGREAVQKAQDLRPDVVIMDISMPDMNGLVATRQIKAKAQDIRVLGLTVHETPDYFFSMLEAGGSGYLLKKDATSGELVSAVRTVYRDGVYLHPAVTKWLIQDRLSKGSTGQERKSMEGLTPREWEVLRMVAEGHSNQEIAEMLHLSPATVQTHRANILQKLGLHSRAELVKYALSRGLIRLEQ
ncbi:MAG: response regulator transcription factor [Chloroflexi bacterium]|nr:response regulator transcription factor [Chloroflexota bacterium]